MRVESTSPSAPRVRDRARDAAVLMAFSAAVSMALAVALLMLVQVAR